MSATLSDDNQGSQQQAIGGGGETLQLTNIVTPHDHDVLSGRGNFVNYHFGNEYFRSLVRKYKMEYVECPKPQKPQIAKKLVDEIRNVNRNPPGRFLKQDRETKLWSDVGEKKALDKTRQALREGAPEIMKDKGGDETAPPNKSDAKTPQKRNGANDGNRNFDMPAPRPVSKVDNNLSSLDTEYYINNTVAANGNSGLIIPPWAKKQDLYQAQQSQQLPYQQYYPRNQQLSSNNSSVNSSYMGSQEMLLNNNNNHQGVTSGSVSNQQQYANNLYDLSNSSPSYFNHKQQSSIFPGMLSSKPKVVKDESGGILDELPSISQHSKMSTMSSMSMMSELPTASQHTTMSMMSDMQTIASMRTTNTMGTMGTIGDGEEIDSDELSTLFRAASFKNHKSHRDGTATPPTRNSTASAISQLTDKNRAPRISSISSVRRGFMASGHKSKSQSSILSAMSDTGLSDYLSNDQFDDYKYVMGTSGSSHRGSNASNDISESMGIGNSGHMLNDMSVTSLGSLTDFNDISDSAGTDTPSFNGMYVASAKISRGEAQRRTNNNANQYISQQRAPPPKRSARGEDETVVLPDILLQQSSFRQNGNR